MNKFAAIFLVKLILSKYANNLDESDKTKLLELISFLEKII